MVRGLFTIKGFHANDACLVSFQAWYFIFAVGSKDTGDGATDSSEVADKKRPNTQLLDDQDTEIMAVEHGYEWEANHDSYPEPCKEEVEFKLGNGIILQPVDVPSDQTHQRMVDRERL